MLSERILQQDDHFGSTADYERVFRALQVQRVPDRYYRMLQAHYAAPRHTLSWEVLAKEVGYKNGNAVNLHYGRLAHMVCTELGISEPPGGWWLLVLVKWASKTDAAGHTLFSLRRPVVEALRSVGILQRSDIPHNRFRVLRDEGI